MNISLTLYRVRIGNYYDKACKLKGFKYINLLTVLLANLLVYVGTKAIPIVLFLLSQTVKRSNNSNSGINSSSMYTKMCSSVATGTSRYICFPTYTDSKQAIVS